MASKSSKSLDEVKSEQGYLSPSRKKSIRLVKTPVRRRQSLFQVFKGGLKSTGDLFKSKSPKESQMKINVKSASKSNSQDSIKESDEFKEESQVVEELSKAESIKETETDYNESSVF